MSGWRIITIPSSIMEMLIGSGSEKEFVYIVLRIAVSRLKRSTAFAVLTCSISLAIEARSLHVYNVCLSWKDSA